jgi:DNA polymerase-3 subunit epsilon
MAENPLIDLPFIARYRKCFETTWDDETPIDDVRFVVLDCETTGLNPRADRIITIGAVAVQNGEILLEDSFDALIKFSRNTGAVTVHGVTRDQGRSGIEETEALESFLDYLKDAVIVGHHIGHDVAMIDTACERHWGIQLANRCFDTVDLALHLEKAGAFSERTPIRDVTLDALCERFGLKPHDRHTASGDAFLTAQILLRLRRFALKYGRERLGLICERLEVDD